MKARTLLTAALVAGVMACGSDPIGPTSSRGPLPDWPEQNPDQVTITGQVMLKDGGVALHAFEGEWAGQVLRLGGTTADELRSHVGAIVRVSGTFLGAVLNIDGFDMILDRVH